jgi:protein tyrosine phosphatase (PTP) superfamily phosphohydrolase (DUF442 family)
MNRWVRRGLIGLAVLVGVIVAGNVLIVGSYLVAARTVDVTSVPEVEGVGNLAVVDDKVWRGANPTREGMRSLAEAGVTTVVDLRPNGERDDDYVRSLGMRPVNIYVPDAQTPGDGDVERFLRVVRESDGTVFVHCSSGVGRSGAMAAAYLARTAGDSGPSMALTNLAIGPSSFEQIWYAALGADTRPNPAVISLSRVLDGPRQLLNRLVG